MSDRNAPVPTGRTDNKRNIQDTGTVDLVELLFRLIANWKLIVALVLLAALIAGVYTTWFVAPKYEATAIIYVLSRDDSVVNLADLQLGTALTSDYIKVFDMWEVHEQVITNLNLPYGYSDMRGMLTISNTSGTRMIDIRVRCGDAKLAADIANEYAKVGSDYIADTMSTLRPNLMSKALRPAGRVSPNRTRSVAAAALAGGVAGALYVFLKMVFDDKYKTSDDIRKYAGLATIALVPFEENRAVRPAKKKNRKGKR